MRKWIIGVVVVVLLWKAPHMVVSFVTGAWHSLGVMFASLNLH